MSIYLVVLATVPKHIGDEMVRLWRANGVSDRNGNNDCQLQSVLKKQIMVVCREVYKNNPTRDLGQPLGFRDTKQTTKEQKKKTKNAQQQHHTQTKRHTCTHHQPTAATDGNDDDNDDDERQQQQTMLDKQQTTTTISQSPTH